MNNCVTSDLLCTKYEVPKLVLMLGVFRVKKLSFVTSHFHALHCITLPIAGEPYFISGFQSYALASCSLAPKAVKW